MGFGSFLSKVADYTPGVSNVKGLVQGNGMQAALGPLAPALDAVKNYTDMSKSPGVGGPAADPTRLVRDPTTGAFFDPATGTSYTDASGATPLANPNLAQQVSANFGARNSFLGKIAGTDATLDQVNARQGALATDLNNTIHNPNAPSVAAAQLAQLQDRDTRQTLGATAGIGGANAYDSRRQAISAIANSNAQTAGNGAILRQKEIADATGALGNVLSQQGAGAQARENTNVTAGSDFSKQAGAAEGTRESNDIDVSKANTDKNFKLGGTGLKFLSAMG